MEPERDVYMDRLKSECLKYEQRTGRRALDLRRIYNRLVRLRPGLAAGGVDDDESKRVIAHISNKHRRRVSTGSLHRSDGMAVLSIKQPAADLILHCGKNIENRSRGKLSRLQMNTLQRRNYTSHSGGNPLPVGWSGDRREGRWVFVHAGKNPNKKVVLTQAQIDAVRSWRHRHNRDPGPDSHMGIMASLTQERGGIIGAMRVVDERKPGDDEDNVWVDSVWGNPGETHLRIAEAFAFENMQQMNAEVRLFGIDRQAVDPRILRELRQHGVRPSEFLKASISTPKNSQSASSSSGSSGSSGSSSNASIHFNSKSFKNGFQGLSNLMGGAEFDYMGARFTQQAMIGLFTELRSCGRETFLEWLKILQPGKKWTPAKLAYWFTPDGEPIRGILAQLLGSMVRRKAGKLTPTSKRRQKVVCEKLRLGTIEVAPELSDRNKKAYMKKCLLKKYSMEPYRSLLLSSGNAELHEKPLRGSGNSWTLPGGDWLGELLMEVRLQVGSGSSTGSGTQSMGHGPT